MVLTNRQKSSLHGAILQYLIDSGLSQTAEVFEKESGITPEASKKEAGKLEQKWTAVMRLQKKIMELEQNEKFLKEELETASQGGRRKKDANSFAVPRPPQKHALKGHRATVTSLDIHPVYSQVASTSEDATVKLWDYESGEFERSLKGHTDVVQCVSYSPSGHMIATCSADLTVKLWETDGYNCVKTLKGHEHNISSVCWMPMSSGKDHVLSSSRDKSIKVWDASTGFCLKTLTGHDEWVRRVKVHEKGAIAASCSNDKTIKVWKLDTYKLQGTLHGHSHVVEDIAFAPSVDAKKEAGSGGGMLLASAGRDKSVKVWDLGTEQLLYSFDGHDNWARGVCFHPNGTYLISVGDDKNLIIWDLKQKREYKRISQAHDHFITSLQMNSRDLVTITGSVDHTLHVWTPS